MKTDKRKMRTSIKKKKIHWNEIELGTRRWKHGSALDQRQAATEYSGHTELCFWALPTSSQSPSPPPVRLFPLVSHVCAENERHWRGETSNNEAKKREINICLSHSWKTLKLLQESEWNLRKTHPRRIFYDLLHQLFVGRYANAISRPHLHNIVRSIAKQLDRFISSIKERKDNSKRFATIKGLKRWADLLNTFPSLTKQKWANH